jgi:hypothetical protein
MRSNGDNTLQLITAIQKVGIGTDLSGYPGGLNGPTQHSTRNQFVVKTKAKITRQRVTLSQLIRQLARHNA